MGMEILSNLDKKIIIEMDNDARLSAAQIAKKLNTSKQLINYRINRLEKKKIIKKYLTVIDPDRLGYSYYNVYLKMQNLSREKEKEFIRYLEEHSLIMWFVRTIGSHDFIISFLAKNTLDFNKYFREIINTYGDYIEHDDLFIIMDAFKLQYKYLSDEIALPKHHYIGKKDLLELKKDDLKILEILDRNGRTLIVKIANELGLSAPVISYKIKNLVKSGLIQGFRPLLDHSMLGLQWYIISFKLNNPSEEEERKFISYLKQNKNIVYLTRGVGAFNLVLDIHVENVIEMDKLLNDIRSKFNRMIKNYTSLLIVDNPKTFFFPNEALSSN